MKNKMDNLFNAHLQAHTCDPFTHHEDNIVQAVTHWHGNLQKTVI